MEIQSDPSLIIIVVLLVALSVWQLIVYIKLKSQYSKLNKRHVDLLSQFETLKTKSEPLWQYQGIGDVDLQIEKRKQEIKKYLIAAKRKAEEIIQQAKFESRSIRAKVKEFVDRSKASASETVQVANAHAADLVRSAEEKAREIAGSALDAKAKAEEYEKTAKAMKNLIDGYGDEYLIPNISVLDDLAEEYSHKDGGRRLEFARKQTRSMIAHNTAASCDYANPYRRRTAIEFVLDAFNGKVDSILTKVKHDNYGKLAQEIKDAYQTVNHNGSAFRNAVITETYLASRLNELRWAVAVNELKLAEREEQRQIREQMRDEERARKEYEKTIREAEKEEKMLQKAMEKARKEMLAASLEEREKLEAQLAELSRQLEEAEAKNQRALSMAQQTRRGHVYVISNIGSFGSEMLKIGMTRRLDPLDRVKELGDASVPFDFDVHAVISAEDAPSLENELHNRFGDSRVNKVNRRKEFFKVALTEVRTLIEELGIETHWTMKAEAVEYRESYAVSQKLKLVTKAIA